MIIQTMSKLFFFSFNNDVKYYIANCITTFQKEKQHWEQICKCLLSAQSGSAGSGKGGSGSAKNHTASASLIQRKPLESMELYSTLNLRTPETWGPVQLNRLGLP